MAVTWPLHGRHMAVPWPFHGRHVAVTWPSRGRHVAVPWPSRRRCMAVTWPLRGRRRWEGSADWARRQFHAHFASLAAEASRRVLDGDASPLEGAHGAAWVRAWAGTCNFQSWAARNGLAAAARLWRARLRSLPSAASEGPKPNVPLAVAQGVQSVTQKVSAATCSGPATAV